MKIRDIVSKIDTEDVVGNLDLKIEGVCYDSRKASKNFLFVAIKGFKVDGHVFIPDAYRKGARAFVVERYLDLPADAVLIKVPSSRKALAQIGSVFYGYPSRKLKIIGVTGTNGKTTVTYLLQSIFQRAGIKVSRLSTTDYNIGGVIYPALTTTPESLDLQELFKKMVSCKTKYAVMEVSSHSLVLHRVDGINFEWAIFTNLSPDHLDFHRNMEEYLKAKLILFETMLPDKRALINLDDPYSEQIIKKSSCRVITYGMKKEAYYCASRWGMDGEKTSFILKVGKRKEKFEISLLGIHNVYNALAAVGVALEEGIPLEIVKEGLREVKGVPGRLEIIENKANLKIYVDYAHTPQSLERVLNTLRKISKGRLIVVFGCGGDRDPYKRPIMGKIAYRLADYTIVTSDNPRSEDPEKIIFSIEEGMLEEGAKKGKDYISIVDRREAIRYALSQMGKDDTLLVAGKGHERVQIFKDKTIPFDDREVLRDLLRSSGLL